MSSEDTVPADCAQRAKYSLRFMRCQDEVENLRQQVAGMSRPVDDASQQSETGEKLKQQLKRIRDERDALKVANKELEEKLHAAGGDAEAKRQFEERLNDLMSDMERTRLADADYQYTSAEISRVLRARYDRVRSEAEGIGITWNQRSPRTLLPGIVDERGIIDFRIFPTRDGIRETEKREMEKRKAEKAGRGPASASITSPPLAPAASSDPESGGLRDSQAQIPTRTCKRTPSPGELIEDSEGDEGLRFFGKNRRRKHTREIVIPGHPAARSMSSGSGGIRLGYFSRATPYDASLTSQFLKRYYDAQPQRSTTTEKAPATHVAQLPAEVVGQQALAQGSRSIREGRGGRGRGRRGNV